ALRERRGTREVAAGSRLPGSAQLLPFLVEHLEAERPHARPRTDLAPERHLLPVPRGLRKRETPRIVRGLLLAARREEAALPPLRARAVAAHEPEEHVAAGGAVDAERGLADVLRLLRPRDPEHLVGRVRLVAVLGQPDVLARPGLLHLGQEPLERG